MLTIKEPWPSFTAESKTHGPQNINAWSSSRYNTNNSWNFNGNNGNANNNNFYNTNQAVLAANYRKQKWLRCHNCGRLTR